MTYEFSLEKKTVVILLSGLTVVGLLLFAAGVLVGAKWIANQTITVAENSTAKPATAQPSPEPVIGDEPQTESADPQTKPEGQAGAPPQVQAAPEATAAAAIPDKSAENESGKAQTPNYSVSLSPPTWTIEPTPVTTFEVQVGAFQQYENAERLKLDLERKGYSPIMFESRDRADNFWFAVRLGEYSDQTVAKQAAANFTQQEKRQAIVRPTGAL